MPEMPRRNQFGPMIMVIVFKVATNGYVDGLGIFLLSPSNFIAGQLVK